MDSFSKKLRDRAKELGISNAEVARRLDLSERRYAYYASGKSEPDLGTLVKIAEALGLTFDELLRPGTSKVKSHREKLLEKLGASAAALADDRLDIAVTIVESLATTAGKQPPKKRQSTPSKSKARR